VRFGVVVAALLAVPAFAGAQAMKGMEMQDQKADAAHQATGKVTKVDRAKGTVSIAHGPVASLRWPAMTMAFGVKDRATLDKLQPGANVEFTFVQSGRTYTITAIK